MRKARLLRLKPPELTDGCYGEILAAERSRSRRERYDGYMTAEAEAGVCRSADVASADEELPVHGSEMRPGCG